MQEALLLFSSRSFKSFAIKKEFCIQIKQHISGAEKEERKRENLTFVVFEERKERSEARQRERENETNDGNGGEEEEENQIN